MSPKAKSRILKRFLKFVKEESSGCWLWQGAKFNGTGYGAFNFDGYSIRGAHRVSFFLKNGFWPNNHALHKCGVRECVNPNHLYDGNDKDNHRDSRNLGTWVPPPVRWGEQNNKHVLTEANVRNIRKDSRSCAEIARELRVSSSTIERVKNGKSWKHLK